MVRIEKIVFIFVFNWIIFHIPFITDVVADNICKKTALCIVTRVS